MKKFICLILLINGIVISAFINGMGVTEELAFAAVREAKKARLAAQRPAQEAAKALEEAQAYQKKITEQKQKAVQEIEEQARIQEEQREAQQRQQALEMLQQSTDRAHQVSEGIRRTASKIGLREATPEVIMPQSILDEQRLAQIREGLEGSSQRIKNAAQRRIDRGAAKDYSMHPANTPLAEGPKFAELPPDIQADILIKETIADIDEPTDFIKRIAPWLRVDKYFKATIYSPMAADIIAQQLSSKFKISRKDAYLAIKTPGATQALSEYLAVQMRNPTKQAAVQTKAEAILRKMITRTVFSEKQSDRIYLLAALDTGLIDPAKMATIDYHEKGVIVARAIDSNDLDLIKAILKSKIGTQEGKDYALRQVLRSSDKKSLAILKLVLDAGADSNSPFIESVIQAFEEAGDSIPFQDQKMKLINEYRQKTAAATATAQVPRQ